MKDFERTYGTRNHVVFFGDELELQVYASRDSAVVAGMGYGVTVLHAPDETVLFAALNSSNVAMALYYGHGSFATNWPLHQGNLDLWRNSGKPLLYFSGGCYFNDNTQTSSPLGHRLLFHDGAAATATGAALGGGYGSSYQFIYALLQDSRSFPTLGELFVNSLREHYDYVVGGGGGGPGSWTYFFTERMMSHGDPALRIDGDVTSTEIPAAVSLCLSQNYPNPFNPTTTIRFFLERPEHVRLTIFDPRGRLVRRLVDGPQPAGDRVVTWPGVDEQNRAVASGLYLYVLDTPSSKQQKKMVLLR